MISPTSPRPMSCTPSATSRTANRRAGRLAMPWPSKRWISSTRLSPASAARHMDQQHQPQVYANNQKMRDHEAEKAQWPLREFGQKEECRNIDQPAQIDARAIQPDSCVIGMLSHGYYIHPISLAQCERGNKSMEIAVERQRLRDRPSHRAYTACHVLELLVSNASDDAMKR